MDRKSSRADRRLAPTRIPRVRRGYTRSFTIDGAQFYLTVNECEDGRAGEVFTIYGKQGSTLSGLMDAVSILISVSLQHGIPLGIIVEKLLNTRYEPMGLTDDADIPEASSVMDYISRRLVLDFQGPGDIAKLATQSAAASSVGEKEGDAPCELPSTAGTEPSVPRHHDTPTQSTQG